MACCLNAACLAVIDGGFYMKYTIAAVCVSIPDDGEDHLEVDHFKSQEEHPLTVSHTQQTMAEQRKLTIAVNNKIPAQIVSSHGCGTFSEEVFENCAQFVHKLSQFVFDQYKNCLKAKLVE